MPAVGGSQAETQSCAPSTDLGQRRNTRTEMRTSLRRMRARMRLCGFLALTTTLNDRRNGVAADQAAPGAAGAGVGKIAAVQNQVETKRRAEAGWSPAAMYQTPVRTGPGPHRPGEPRRDTLFGPNPPQGRREERDRDPGAVRGAAGNPEGGLGDIVLLEPVAKDYGRIETPTVTAAIKGTEFVVEVAEDQTTKITMLEGVVKRRTATAR